MPIDPSSHGPDVWELFERAYQEILEYEEEQKYEESLALQRAG